MDMSRYEKLLEDLYEIQANIQKVLDAYSDVVEVGSLNKQFNLDVQISSLEITMTNAAKTLRERLLV